MSAKKKSSSTISLEKSRKIDQTIKELHQLIEEARHNPRIVQNEEIKKLKKENLKLRKALQKYIAGAVVISEKDKEKIATIITERDELLEKNETLNKTLTLIQSRFQHHAVADKGIKAELEHLRQLRTDFEARQMILSEAIEKKDKQIHELKSQIINKEHSTSQFQQAKKEMEKLANEVLRQTKREKEIEKEKTTLEKKIKKVFQHNKTLKLLVNEYRNREELNLSVEEITKLRQQTEASKNLAEKHRKLQHDFDLLKSQHESLEKQMHFLRETTKSKVNTHQSLQSRLTELEQIRTTLARQTKWFERALAEKKAEAETLKKAIIIEKEKKAIADRENTELLGRMERLAKENDQLGQMVDKLSADLRKKSTAFDTLASMQKSQEQSELKSITRDFMRKELAMKMEVENLRNQLKRQQSLLDERKSREQEIILSLNQKFRSLFSEQLKQLQSSQQVIDDIKVPVSELSAADDLVVSHLIPLVKIAMEHNAEPEQIKESLLTSGYEEKEINAALQRLHLA